MPQARLRKPSEGSRRPLIRFHDTPTALRGSDGLG